jgi:hypothetical protein
LKKAVNSVNDSKDLAVWSLTLVLKKTINDILGTWGWLSKEDDSNVL